MSHTSKKRETLVLFFWQNFYYMAKIRNTLLHELFFVGVTLGKYNNKHVVEQQRCHNLSFNRWTSFPFFYGTIADIYQKSFP